MQGRAAGLPCGLPREEKLLTVGTLIIQNDKKPQQKLSAAANLLVQEECEQSGPPTSHKYKTEEEREGFICTLKTGWLPAPTPSVFVVLSFLCGPQLSVSPPLSHDLTPPKN